MNLNITLADIDGSSTGLTKADIKAEVASTGKTFAFVARRQLRELHGLTEGPLTIMTWKRLGLSNYWTEYLRSRGVSPLVAWKNGVMGVRNSSELPEWGDGTVEGVKWTTDQMDHLNRPDVEGLLIPWHDRWEADEAAERKMARYELKYNKVRTVKYKDHEDGSKEKTREVKCDWPAGALKGGHVEERLPVGIDPMLFAPDGYEGVEDATKVVFAEGKVKLMAVATAAHIESVDGEHPLPIIGQSMSGVHGIVAPKDQWLNGRPHLHDGIVAVKGMDVLTFWDPDYKHNPGVLLGLLRSGELLTKAGAQVYVPKMPDVEGLDSKAGVDDILAALAADPMSKSPKGHKAHLTSMMELAMHFGVFSQKWKAYTEEDRLVGQPLIDELRVQSALYSKTLGWLVFNGRHYVTEAESEVAQVAKEVGRRAYSTAGKEQTQKVRLTELGPLVRRHRINDASLAPGISVKKDAEFDVVSTLFCASNCMVDLFDESEQDFDPKYLAMASSPIAYNPEADKTFWTNFCRRIFVDHNDVYDPELEEMAQRIVGSWLLGGVHEYFFLIWGDPGRGKSVFMHAVHLILGSYAKVLNTKVLFGGGNQFSMSPFIGSRLVVAAESKAKDYLDTALVKILTGGDAIPVELKGKDAGMIQNRASLALMTNFLPRLEPGSHADYGLIRRMVALPFLHDFHNDPVKDKDVRLTVDANAESILLWAVQGASKFIADGKVIEPCETSKKITADYFHKEDPMSEFFDSFERTDNDEDRFVRTALYSGYEQWCMVNRRTGVLGRNKFFEACRKAGIREKADKKNRYFVGLKVIEEKVEGVYALLHPEKYEASLNH